jgi:hypothetical protein
METILKEIEGALQANLYYLAIVMALTLPDICAALEAQDGRTSQNKYKAWYNANLAAKLSFLSADDCYSLRCGVVHQGKFGDRLTQYDRPLFVLPSNAVFMNCKVARPDGEFYLTSAAEFCLVMIAAVRQWFAAKGQDGVVKANLPNLMQYHPTGYGPVQGAGVIT